MQSVVQPVKYLMNWLEKSANDKHYLFTSQNLRVLFPNLSNGAFKALLSRAVCSNYLYRVCRGVYMYQKTAPLDGLQLFHVAALLRADTFNYISLESVLSDLGIISQIPMNRIFIQLQISPSVYHRKS